MVVRFTTTYAIIAYHHGIYEFKPHSWQDVLDTTLCDKVCQRLAKGQWFSPGTSVSSTNKTDRHDITEILLKVALNTINHKTINSLQDVGVWCYAKFDADATVFTIMLKDISFVWSMTLLYQDKTINTLLL